MCENGHLINKEYLKTKDIIEMSKCDSNFMNQKVNQWFLDKTKTKFCETCKANVAVTVNKKMSLFPKILTFKLEVFSIEDQKITN